MNVFPESSITLAANVNKKTHLSMQIEVSE